MGKAIKFYTITGVFMVLFSFGNMSEAQTKQTTTKPPQTTKKTTPKPPVTTTKSTKTTSKTPQTKPKSTQTTSKPAQTKADPTKKITVPVPEKINKVSGTVTIGTQTWALANLNVNTFQNGDSITEARTNKEWETLCQSGKPAWCYYNNDPLNGQKFGKLYNWYALNDPGGLAPAGWTLPGDADWVMLINFLGGQESAGIKMKTTTGWFDGNNGSNDSGFSGLPGGYRVENGAFVNLGSIGTWWSSTESKSSTAIDFYLALRSRLERSNNSKQRGESVRCLRK